MSLSKFFQRVRNRRWYIVLGLGVLMAIGFVYFRNHLNKPSTPEAAFEAVIRALENNDAERAASFSSAGTQEHYQELFFDIDLRALAVDLRRFPPVRLDDPSVQDGWADFLTKRNIDGEVTNDPVTFILEHNRWKFLNL